MTDTPHDPSADQLDSLIAEYLEAVDAGREPSRQRLLDENPELREQLQAFFNDDDRLRDVGDEAVDVDAPTLNPAAETGGDFDAPTVLPGQRAAPDEGERIRYFGDYELLEEIARGGMGVVYKAMQINLKRTVALKMILAGQFAGDADVQRFHAEAEAAAQLDHQGIVPIYEIGQHGGQHYFSMAFVEGHSLADELRDGPLAPRDAAELLAKVSEAIAYAHARGIVHRDLKPANVLIDKDGTPRVTDFGLAKRTETDSGLTGTGQILGTPSYMPPEQASGRTEEVGPLADVYSLGAILYCALTGRPPFQAANVMDTLMQVLEREPTPPRELNPEVPRDLETICLKCLRKEPDRRYESARELANDLRRFLSGEPIRGRRVGQLEKTWKWCRRKPLVASLAALAALSVAPVAMAIFDSAIRARTGEILVRVGFNNSTAVLYDNDGHQIEPLSTEEPDQLRYKRLEPGTYWLKRYHPDDADEVLAWRRILVGAGGTYTIENLAKVRQGNPSSPVSIRVTDLTSDSMKVEICNHSQRVVRGVEADSRIHGEQYPRGLWPYVYAAGSGGLQPGECLTRIHVRYAEIPPFATSLDWDVVSVDFGDGVRWLRSDSSVPEKAPDPDPEIATLVAEAKLILTFDERHFTGHGSSLQVRDMGWRGIDTSAAGASFTPDGLVGGALRIDGGEGLLVKDGLVASGDPYTIAGWIWLDWTRESVNPKATVFSNRSGERDGFSTSVSRVGEYFKIGHFTPAQGDQPGQESYDSSWGPFGFDDDRPNLGFAQGRWGFVAFRRDAERRIGYTVDGLSNWTSPGAIGNRNVPESATFGPGTSGRIDEFVVFDRVLTDAEIALLYRHGRAGRGLAEGGPVEMSTPRKKDDGQIE